MKRIFLFCQIAIAGNSYAQNKAHQLDSLFSKLYIEKKFTGNVLIAEKGKPMFQKSYGKAFHEKGLDLNSESVFELASVSKQFTAMGIMILKKQGKLSYADSLRKFFPELPYHNISVGQLLNHVSGLPDYIDLADEHWDKNKIMTNKDMIQLLANKKPALVFTPGDKWEYSNTGYALLASIIEKASGQTFKQFMAQQIFKPLGMKRSQVYQKRWENNTMQNYAYGYLFNDSLKRWEMADSSKWVRKMVYYLDGIYGDGCINSTSTDLLKWDQALYSQKLVSKEMMKEAFTAAPLNNGKTFNYGFGWILWNSKDLGFYVNHSGGWPGYTTWIERHPRDNKTIILLANGGYANNKIKEIRNILYGLTEQKPVEINVDSTLLKQYTGEFQFPSKRIMKITMDQGKLFAEGAGQDKIQLHAEEPDLFFVTDGDYKIRFLKNENAETTAINIITDNPAREAIKIK